MNIKEVLSTTVDYFNKYKISSPRLDAEVLLAHVMEKERIQLYVNYDLPLKKDELEVYRQLVYHRARRVPTAYLIGKKEFMSLDINVDEGVLIPRPETEQLVEYIIDYCKGNNLSEPNIVDVGTGSGAIAVSLSYYIPGAKILAIDISDKALKTARINIKKYELWERVKLIKGDLLSPLLSLHKDNVDIIVSNPPYVDDKGMEELSTEVQYEPEVALSGGFDGLDYYRRLIPQTGQVLKKDGLLALEIGYNQGSLVKNLFDSNWYNICIKKDYSNHERMVFATFKVNNSNIIID